MIAHFCSHRFFVALLLSLLTPLTSSAWVQTPTVQDAVPRTVSATRSLKISDWSHLKAVLESVATQTGQAFIVEGEPQTARLRPPKPPSLDETNIPAEEAIARIATAFDYIATKKGKIFVLRRAYSDFTEIPGVTLEEFLLTLQDCNRLFAPFANSANNHSSLNPDLQGFISSFTPEQLERLNPVGTRIHSMSSRPAGMALTISEMTANQQKMVRNLAFDGYTGRSVSNTQLALSEARDIINDRTAFEWGQVAGVRFFGYSPARGGATDKPPFLPLSGSNQAQMVNGSLQVVTKNSSGGTDIPFPSDPTTPPEGAVLSPSTSVERETGTLAEIVLGFARRHNRSWTVEAALAPKPCAYIGSEDQPADEVLAALAQMYGLRVRTDNQGTQILSRPAFRQARTIEELQGALLNILPAPFVQVLSKQLVLMTQAQRLKENREKFGASSPFKSDYEERLTQLRDSAARRMRTTLEPRVNAAHDHRILLPELTNAEKQAFADVLLSEYLVNLRSVLTVTPPLCLTRPESLCLGGGVSTLGGNPSFVLSLFQPSPDGTRLECYGVLEVRTDLLKLKQAQSSP